MQISIIIPTLNEAEGIADVLLKTRALDGGCEIIVADGGSTDGTLSLTDVADVSLTAPRGRASQQNAAAAAATGDVLLFLHADCWLEPGAIHAIRGALADEEIVGGCFQQSIDAVGIRYRLLEWGNAQRVRSCKLAYGDQGIFVRREMFQSVGGFPDIQLMEDLFLMKRLRRIGRIALLDTRIHVSARRWQQQGVVRQTLRNWSLLALARCGVCPNRLVGFYPHVRRDKQETRV